MFCSFDAASCNLHLTEQSLSLAAQVSTSASSKPSCAFPFHFLGPHSQNEGGRRYGFQRALRAALSVGSTLQNQGCFAVVPVSSGCCIACHHLGTVREGSRA